MPQTVVKQNADRLDSICAYSVVSRDRLEHLMRLASSIGHIPGDVVECGVAAGGSAAAIGLAIKDSGRTLWLYDSFQGLPQPTDKDGPRSARYAGANRCSSDSAKRAIETVGFPASHVRIVEGWFTDTLRREGPDTIAFLHIDADWYESVKTCLEAFYGRVSRGGVIVLDDYGYWPGCRRALYEFCTAQAIAPRLERFDDQAWWMKGLGE